MVLRTIQQLDLKTRRRAHWQARRWRQVYLDFTPCVLPDGQPFSAQGNLGHYLHEHLLSQAPTLGRWFYYMNGTSCRGSGRQG
jgi:hypothetical protein